MWSPVIGFAETVQSALISSREVTHYGEQIQCVYGSLVYSLRSPSFPRIFLNNDVKFESKLIVQIIWFEVHTLKEQR